MTRQAGHVGSTIFLFLLALTGCDYFGTPRSPYALTKVAVLSTPGYARDIALSGNCVYVPCDSCLLVVNVANPSGPYEEGRLSLSSQGEVPTVIHIRDSLALLGMYGAVLIVDIREPANPRLVSVLDGPGYQATYGLVADSMYAYFSNGSHLCVADISDPTTPQLVASVTPPGGHGDIWRVVKRDNYIYAMGETGLHAFVAVDPDTPLYLKTLMMPYESDIWIYGPWSHGAIVENDLFMSYGALRDIDISNSSAPVFGSTVAKDGYVCGVAVQDSFLCYGYGRAAPSAGRTIEVTVIGKLYAPAKTEVDGPVYSVVISGEYVYAALGDAGVAVYRLERWR